MDRKVIPLYVKAPINCYSNRVSRYNEHSAWKIGLDFSKDKEWMKMYSVMEMNERLNISLENVQERCLY